MGGELAKRSLFSSYYATRCAVHGSYPINHAFSYTEYFYPKILLGRHQYVGLAYDQQEIALRLMVTFSYSLLHPQELLIG
jgi:hypothetical protein